jgi:hypothetical protein
VRIIVTMMNTISPSPELKTRPQAVVVGLQPRLSVMVETVTTAVLVSLLMMIL